MSYENDEDLELILKVRQNDEYAYNKLAQKYLFILGRIVNNVAVSLLNDYYCEEEYLLEYTIAIQNAIKNYDKDCGEFFSYFKVVLARKIKDSMLQKMDKERKHFELDTPLDDDVPRMVDNVADYDDVSPTSYTNMKEVSLLLRSQSNTLIDTTKEQIFLLKIFGYSLTEIASRMGMSVSKVRRYLQSFSDGKLSKIVIRLK